jgi:hypothetical protein
MLHISLSASTRDPRKYKWLKYTGRKAQMLAHDSKKNEYDLVLSKGAKYGIKRIGKFTYMLFESDLTIQLKLDTFDADRVIKNSKGFEGKIGRHSVEKSTGGLDGVNSTLRDLDGNAKKVKVDSSMFNQVAYDTKRKALIIEFRSGAIWEYEDVSSKEVLEFERAPSQGRWYNTYIKGDKESNRVHGNTNHLKKSHAMKSGKNKI